MRRGRAGGRESEWVGGGEVEVRAGNHLDLPETLYHRHDALLYIAYIMLIWAAPIPAHRWHCSLWP